MNIWEIVILVIVGSICVFGGIGAVYSSIVKTVERYQIHKETRSMQMFIKVMEIMPDMFGKIIDVMQKKMNEEEERRKKQINSIFKDTED